MKIVAEIGSNFETLDDCRHSIRIAKAVGADVVKFQLYDHTSLYGVQREDYYLDQTPPVVLSMDPPVVTGFEAQPVFELEHALPIDWLPQLKQQADNAGIEFMCSAFSPELIDAVDPFVSIHKVASAEMCHVRMLERLRQIGKPVYLSTGGHNFSDIFMALKVLAGFHYRADLKEFVHTDPAQGSPPVTLLHCVSAYPTQETNLERIVSLRDTFHLPVGYSDHSGSIDDIPLMATKYCGAVVLEKHFKDRDYNSPDNGHSLNPEQFKKMVSYLKGERTDSYLGCENDMALKHNRRLIAIKDIKPGDALQEGINFGIYRSLKEDAKGFHPFAARWLEGRLSSVALSAGDAIPPMEFH